MEREIEVKIRTKKGRIITLTNSKKTDRHICGIDKFGVFTIVPIEDIDSMMGDKND